MPEEPDVHDIAAALQASIGLVVRQLRQTQAGGDLSWPERSALSRLDRGGPATPTTLARLDEITPQSMGATLAGLESRGFVERTADPGDGRRAIMSITPSGQQALQHKRNARTERLAQALSAGFTEGELKKLKAATPLIERLAQSL